MNSEFDGDDFKITLDQNPVLDSDRAKQERLNQPSLSSNPYSNNSPSKNDQQS